MNDLFWLTDAQMARLAPSLPKSHGKPRVDDKRVPRGISSSIAMACGGEIRLPPIALTKHGVIAAVALYSRWKHWSEKSILARMMAEMAAEHGEKSTVMIDAPRCSCQSSSSLRSSSIDYEP